MKIARFSIKNGARFGVLNEENGRYYLLAGDPLYSGFTQSGEVLDAKEVRFVAPMLPRSKVIGVTASLGLTTYSETGSSCAQQARSAQTWGQEDPGKQCADALLGTYLKPNTAVIGTDVPIVIPQWAQGQKVVASPQLGLIVSRPAKEVPADLIAQIVFGYMLVVSVSFPELAEFNPAAAYAFDCSCPSGPLIATGLPAGRFDFSFDVGDQGYDACIEIDPAQLAARVAKITEIATLLPGDIILTGPLGQALQVHDKNEIVFENTELGSLRNQVLQ